MTRARLYPGLAPGQEPEGESADYRTTTMTYDGHGRLHTRHESKQNSGRVTSFTYYGDDRLKAETDARGATTAFTYNGRHLVESAAYSLANVIAGQNVGPAAPVTFEYDEAGNRKKMTDGLGNVTYTYDNLSRLRAEKRTFHDPQNQQIHNAEKTIAYDYTPAGLLKSVTDPFGTRVDYDYDRAGQLRAVTGSPYLTGGTFGTPAVHVSQYVTDIKYRAWGALKGVDYGNGLHLSMTYTQRLQPEEFRVFGSSDKMRSKYAHYEDGQVKTVDDMVDNKFDRAYRYDHAGRLLEAFSGAQALNFVPTAPDNFVPYWQRYEYDTFGNVTRRQNHYWTRPDTAVAGYDLHDRRQGQFGPLDGHDAEGNVVNSGGTTLLAYDAAGVNTSVTDTNNTFRARQWADGLGQVLKRQEERLEDNGQGTSQAITYYLRSTALGGAVLCDLNARGEQLKTRVYMGGEVLAELLPNWVVWRHEDPLTGTRGVSDRNGAFVDSGQRFDPSGVNVADSNPFIDPDPRGEELEGVASLAPGLGPGKCSIDGAGIDCAWAYRLLWSGAAVGCPDNNCGPRVVTLTARGRDGRVMGSSSVLVRQGQAGWDGSLDGTYRVMKGRSLSPRLMSNAGALLRALAGTRVGGVVEIGSVALRRASDTSYPEIASLGGWLPGPTQDGSPRPDFEPCVTPNKIINFPAFRSIFERQWERTKQSGQENGTVLILEPQAQPIALLHSRELSEGRHVKMGIGNVPAMPEAAGETDKHLASLRRDGRRVVLLAFFHTHPDLYGGRSRTNDPSGDDYQFQFEYGNALGIIRTSNGYSFFSNGTTFWPDNPKADECLQYRKVYLW